MLRQFHESESPNPRQTRAPLEWRERGPQSNADSLLDRALGLAKIGAWSCDVSTNRLTWSTGVFELFGLPTGHTPDRRDVVTMYAKESVDEMEWRRANAITHGGAFTFDAQIVRPDGDSRWMRVTGEAVCDARGATILHGLKQDITEEKLRIDTLRNQAENDALTGLSSRAVYESRFLNRNGGAPAMAPLGALILFDLDEFKGINDRFGHAAGDLYLKEFAARLTAAFPDALLAARIGGDEFAVVLAADTRQDAAQIQLASFFERLRAPIVWCGQMITIAATSGVAMPDNSYAYVPEELFARADAALYASKRARLAQIRVTTN